jgi:TonB family protein
MRIGDGNLVVLADAGAENLSATSAHSRERFAAKVATVDSVAQFRAANRAAHRREQRMKALYSLLTLAGLAAAVTVGRSWLSSHPEGVEVSSKPIIQSVTSVTQKISQALPKRTPSLATEPAAASTAPEPPAAPQRPSAQHVALASSSNSNVISDSTAAVSEPEAPAPVERQSSEAQVAVRHGSSFAAAHKLATEDAGEAPEALPLHVTETANLQPKPEVLSDAVTSVPAKSAVLATQVPRRAVPAKLIHSVPAQYPAMARQLHLEGEVLLSLDVDAAGNVASVKALSGPPLLRAAAMDAVKRWKYQPATLGDQPVSSTETVKVDFHWR